MEVMDYQVHAIRKAIRPLFADLVIYIDALVVYACRFTNYNRKAINFIV